jgi:hypothetical protein
MALDKDILGTAIYNVRQSYVNRDYNDLISEFGNMDAARLAQAKDEAHAIIDHFKNYAQINATTGVGLTAGVNPVVGESTANIIE